MSQNSKLEEIDNQHITGLSQIATNWQNDTSIKELPPCTNAGEGYDMLLGIKASSEQDLYDNDCIYLVTTLPFINSNNINEKILLGWDGPNSDYTMRFAVNELAYPTNEISRESWPFVIITNFKNLHNTTSHDYLSGSNSGPMGENIAGKEVFFIIPNSGNKRLTNRMSKTNAGKPYDFDLVAEKLSHKFGASNIFRYNYCEVEQTKEINFTAFYTLDNNVDPNVKKHPRYSKDKSVCETPRDATNRVLDEIFKQKGKPHIFKKSIMIEVEIKHIYVSYDPDTKKSCSVINKLDENSRYIFKDYSTYFINNKNEGEGIVDKSLINQLKNNESSSYYQIKILFKKIFDFITKDSRGLNINKNSGINILKSELITKLNKHLQNVYDKNKDYTAQIKNIIDFISYLQTLWTNNWQSISTGAEFETQYLATSPEKKQFESNFKKSDLTNLLLLSWSGQEYSESLLGDLYIYFLTNLTNPNLSSSIKNCIQFLDGYFSDFDLKNSQPDLYKFKEELLARL